MNRVNRVRMASAVLLAITSGGVALAADPAPTTSGPGWTGVTKVKDVIIARQELMEHAEILMEPIDTITVKEVEHEDQLRSNAEAIGAMIGALPHLFPPTTNLYDPKVQEPKTLALPTIWKDFDDFYKLATAASVAAEAMADTHGKQQLRAASLRLRASCDACHALYLRPYKGPTFQDSDYKFDFDSALHKK
jgi:cytochrome c556